MNDHDGAKAFYRKLEALLATALEKTSGVLDEQDVEDVRQYIAHGEYGVGWELLWHLVNDKKLEAPAELVESGEMMNFDVSRQA